MPLFCTLTNNRSAVPPLAFGLEKSVTGEQTGEMEAMLGKVADYQESEAEHAMGQLITVVGVLLFLAVAAVIASQVITFWRGYAGGIQQAGSE